MKLTRRNFGRKLLAGAAAAVGISSLRYCIAAAEEKAKLVFSGPYDCFPAEHFEGDAHCISCTAREWRKMQIDYPTVDWYGTGSAEKS